MNGNKKCFSCKIETKPGRWLTGDVFLTFWMTDYFCKVRWSSPWNPDMNQLSLICWLVGQILSVCRQCGREVSPILRSTLWDGWEVKKMVECPLLSPPVTFQYTSHSCLQTYLGRSSQSANRPWRCQGRWAPIPACLYLLLHSSAPACHRQPADGCSRANWRRTPWTRRIILVEGRDRDRSSHNSHRHQCFHSLQGCRQ